MKHVLQSILACLALLSTTALHAATAPRPNFLFVYTDDQRWDALGVVQREQGDRARFPWLQTPHMDRLAAEGLRFRNAFVTLSLCAPSRAAFLTGRYNHVNGIANNHTDFPTQSQTYATVLRQAGYVTGYVGKWHMGSQSGQRPGFDFSASFVGQGKYFDCPIEVNGVATPSQGWVDDVSTDYAVNFIRQHQQHTWALTVGFKATHGPFTPPARAEPRYPQAEARPVPNLDTPAIYLSAPESSPKKKKAKPSAAPSKRSARPTNLGYFRCISAADDNLGRLLATLDELGLSENTVVIFSSDNGYYLGEHGLGDKRTAYDESLRIPLLVRYPKLGPAAQGRTIDEMALNIDLAPTLLDLAGATTAATPPAMQGQSWRPLLENTPPQPPWRQSFLFEYFREGRFGAPTVYGVRTAQAKLIHYPGHSDWTEVFDLKNDPYELHNLATDPAHTALRTQLEAELEKQTKQTAFVIPDYADEKTSATPPPPTPAANRTQGIVLSYNFTHDAGTQVQDDSNHRNTGTAHSAPLQAGRSALSKARHFDGQAHIEVPKSPSLDPSHSTWTVETVIKTEQPTGIILARGGKTQGYALHLVDGHPAFTLNSGNTTSTVTAKLPLPKDWVHLAAVLDADHHLHLYLNGQLAGSTPAKNFLTSDPNDTMQLGADLGSPVISSHPPAFTGLIESVRIYNSARTAPEIAQDATP